MLLSPAGEWMIGENQLGLTFDSAPHNGLIDAGAPALAARLPVVATAPRRTGLATLPEPVAPHGKAQGECR
jgi:hypothetical protein